MAIIKIYSYVPLINIGCGSSTLIPSCFFHLKNYSLFSTPHLSSINIIIPHASLNNSYAITLTPIIGLKNNIKLANCIFVPITNNCTLSLSSALLAQISRLQLYTFVSIPLSQVAMSLTPISIYFLASHWILQRSSICVWSMLSLCNQSHGVANVHLWDPMLVVEGLRWRS